MTITEERAHLLALPRLPFDTDEVGFGRVSKDGFVPFDTNDYSVPPGFAGQLLEIRADDQTVTVRRAGNDMVRHGRSFRKYQTIVIPAHENLAAYRAQWLAPREVLPSIPVEERDHASTTSWWRHESARAPPATVALTAPCGSIAARPRASRQRRLVA